MARFVVLPILVVGSALPPAAAPALGGSGALALLNGFDGVVAECELGVGWQDPAVIRETGCCVWESGPKQVLDFIKRSGDFLNGCMAIEWTGGDHDTPGVANNPRDYAKIAEKTDTRRAVDPYCTFS